MTASEGPAQRTILDEIHRAGPLPFDRYVELALYGDGGFFATGQGAGRAGADFVTSPEVGRLFGRLVAAALDRWWRELGAPDPFFVVEVGAGRGRLAADVLAAAPDCAPALRYVLVERSATLRDAQRELLVLEPPDEVLGPRRGRDASGDDDGDAAQELQLAAGPICCALGELPGALPVGVVLANELLDNLPFRIVERTTSGWDEVRVGATDDGALVEIVLPAAPPLVDAAEFAAGVEVGQRVPVPTATATWLADVAAVLRRGRVALVDYFVPVDELAARTMDGWLRTYRAHGRGEGPLIGAGAFDVTTDVPLEAVTAIARRLGFTVVTDITQREWLHELGVEGAAAESRAAWDAQAHVGDLAALMHRSTVHEAAALTDPSGLGAHRVVVLQR